MFGSGSRRTGKVFSDGNVRVPSDLSAGDFDWVNSRPVAQWSIGHRLGEHYVVAGGLEDEIRWTWTLSYRP